MEATWDDQMLWSYPEDGDELVIPGWIKFLKYLDNGANDDDIYFSDVMIPEPELKPNPQLDGDVVVEDPHTLKKVEKHPDDALFQELGDAQVPCTKLHNFPQSAIDTLAKDFVVKILCHKSASWENLRQMCFAANDYVLYHRSIEVAASLVFMIYNKASLFRFGHERSLNKQMDALHEEVLAQGAKACPDYEVGKLIVRLTADKKKYSLVTEGSLAEMLTYFPRNIPTGYNADYQDQVFEDISKVVRAMKQSSLPILEVDDHTRFLISFLNKESQEEMFEFACDAMVSVKPDAVERSDEGDDIFVCLWIILLGLSTYIRLTLQGHLSRVTAPFFELYNPGCHISSKILDIVEVAEIRRMALGSRFISRSYLLWAFYELGYGVPPKIRNAIKIFPLDKDVPPYHIYVAALKLAEYCGGGNMEIQHFLCAVIFAKEDIIFEGKELEELAAHFRDFIIALESSLVRTKPDLKPLIRIQDDFEKDSSSGS